MRRVGGISAAEPRAPVPSWQLPPWAQRAGVRDRVGLECLALECVGLDCVGVQSELVCPGSTGSGGAQCVAPGISVLPSQRAAAILPPLLSHIH